MLYQQAYGENNKEIFMLTLFVVQSSIRNPCAVRSRSLLNWKRSLISSSSLLSWTLTNSTSSNPCDWTRIKCDGVGTIVEINLADSGLDGTLDRFDFSAFPNLTSLNLYFNMLVGRIPFGLGNATKLRLLYQSSSLIRS